MDRSCFYLTGRGVEELVEYPGRDSLRDPKAVSATRNSTASWRPVAESHRAAVGRVTDGVLPVSRSEAGSPVATASP